MPKQIPFGWNPNWKAKAAVAGTGSFTLSNQNRTVAAALTTASQGINLPGFQGKRFGKSFCEITITDIGTHGGAAVGIGAVSGIDPTYNPQPIFSDAFQGANTGCYRCDGKYVILGSVVATVAPFGPGDVIGIALHAIDNATTIEFFKNGASQGVMDLAASGAASVVVGGLAAMIGLAYLGSNYTDTCGGTINGGDDVAVPFVYAIPAGYTAWAIKAVLDPGTDASTVHGNMPDDLTLTAMTAEAGVCSNFGRTSGKFYFEVVLGGTNNADCVIVSLIEGNAAGTRLAGRPLGTPEYLRYNFFYGQGVYGYDQSYNNPSDPAYGNTWGSISPGMPTPPSAVGSNYTYTNIKPPGPPQPGDTLGFAVDMDNGNFYVTLNGVLLGGPTAGQSLWSDWATSGVYAQIGAGGDPTSATASINFDGPFYGGATSKTLTLAGGSLTFQPWSQLTTPSIWQAVFNTSAGSYDLSAAVKTANLTADNSDASGTWSWDFGDGSAPVTTFQPSHTYKLPGTYAITLTATRGSDGATSTWTRDVIITGRAKPRFAYSNILKTATSLTASNADASHPGVNVTDDLEVTYWLPGVIGTQTLTAVYSSIRQASCLCFYAHNLFETGASVKLQRSTDSGTTWLDVTGFINPQTKGACCYIPFQEVGGNAWRVTLANCTVDTYVGLINIGQDFELEHGLYDDSFSPPGLSEIALVTNSVAENGAFLGRIGLQISSLLVITPNWMSEAFCWVTWFPFLRYIELNPFWFLWNPSEYPEVAAWGQTTGTPTAVSYNTMSQMTTVVNAMMKID